jgi:hypothetical protein
MRRVVLVGASGAFGRRLADLLARWPDIELVLAARRVEPLETMRAELMTAGATAKVSALSLDRERPDGLDAVAPWLVIDVSGPFQAYGYGLALAAVRGGAHYIDLADARAFVAGFAEAVGPAAQAASVLAVTGASSTPALSNAVLETLVEGWRGIDTITVAICPGARAPRGLSVIRSILSYAGQPVMVFSGGAWRDRPGWSRPRRLFLPGLGTRLASLCETPDLDLLPARFRPRLEAVFLAGLELAPVQIGLWLLSLPVRWGWCRSIQPLAKPLQVAADAVARIGSDRGGMLVTASGVNADGEPIAARWALWADANAGPSVPVAAAAALARRLLTDRETRTGAEICVGLLKVSDILAEMNGLPIRTRTDASLTDSAVLFRRLLGPAVSSLPASVRAVHDRAEAATFTGRAVARSGRGIAGAIARRLIGLPQKGFHRVEVRIDPLNDGERWTRRFGGQSFNSRLMSTPELGRFEEQFGPIRFAIELQATAHGVIWALRSWRILGVAAPVAWAPNIRARAEDDQGRYRFRVVVAHRWFGIIFAYRGILNVDAAKTDDRPLTPPRTPYRRGG